MRVSGELYNKCKETSKPRELSAIEITDVLATLEEADIDHHPSPMRRTG